MKPNEMMEFTDNVVAAAESLGGFRRALIAQGFSEEQAGDIVVAVVEQNGEGTEDEEP